MCGRYTLTANLETIESRFGISAAGVEFQPRYNICPTQDAPVIVSDGGRIMRTMRWGLVPYWAKDDSTGGRMINARAETIAEKPSFKKPYRERRCLVIADGFYEWRKSEKNIKTPLHFRLRAKEPFAFAGLWDSWRKQDGATLLTFTIITAEANDLMRPVHDRMPVILRKEDENLWLDVGIRDTERLKRLLVRYPSDLMEAYEVSTLVNSPKNDSPECIKPVSVI